MTERVYMAIDLKSFYASVECRQRGLDPLDTNLVVADPSRTDKTICLATSPALKSFGVPGRCRLFEVKQRIQQINRNRRLCVPGRTLRGSSWFVSQLQRYPEKAVDFIIAPPRMALYIDYSTAIYSMYLRYIAPEDIVVYSIDEVFMDITDYVRLYKLTPQDLAKKIIEDVFRATGITATAGIGTNLFLSKVAMDIVAKHIQTDNKGFRIAQLDEATFRRQLWSHTPLTDFWRIGPGYAKKLESRGLFTLGDIARQSLRDENMLYKLFGKNAELLIDHAWGWEPCTIQAIKEYKPAHTSVGSGQVLHSPYPWEKARLVTKEMAESLALDLVDKGLVTNQIVLTVGYDIENLATEEGRQNYKGTVVMDSYGRLRPKHAHGTINLKEYTASAKKILTATEALFDKITDKNLLVRRVNIVANHVLDTLTAEKITSAQLPLFTEDSLQDESAEEHLYQKQQEKIWHQKEETLQQDTLKLKKRFGKNAILKGMNLEEGATTKDRNRQIGGHKA